jgi:hypothetical protein
MPGNIKIRRVVVETKHGKGRLAATSSLRVQFKQFIQITNKMQVKIL